MGAMVTIRLTDKNVDIEELKRRLKTVIENETNETVSINSTIVRQQSTFPAIGGTSISEYTITNKIWQ
jgi:hypothetical protein